MGANFGPFFKHHDIEISIKLLQSDRSRQTRRSGSDDHHVIFHAFAFNLSHVSHPLNSAKRASVLFNGVTV